MPKLSTPALSDHLADGAENQRRGYAQGGGDQSDQESDKYGVIHVLFSEIG